MTPVTIDLDEWLTCLAEVASGFAVNHLRFDGSFERGGDEGADVPQASAYVAILGEGVSMHLGLATTPQGCQALTRAFLGLRGREVLSDREVVDGMNEILNILAGKVKSRLSARDSSLKLGLPMFVPGTAGRGEGVERASAAVSLGPVPCQLQVFRQARSAPGGAER